MRAIPGNPRIRPPGAKVGFSPVTPGVLGDTGQGSVERDEAYAGLVGDIRPQPRCYRATSTELGNPRQGIWSYRYDQIRRYLSPSVMDELAEFIGGPPIRCSTQLLSGVFVMVM